MHPGVNLGKSIAVALPHDVYLGVMKRLMGYWLDRKHQTKERVMINQVFFFFRKAGIMPERVQSVRVPNGTRDMLKDVSMIMQTLKNTFAMSRGSEYLPNQLRGQSKHALCIHHWSLV